MRKAAALLFDGFFLALLAAAVVTAWQWPFATGLFPLTIAVSVLLVAAAQFARDACRDMDADGAARERIRDIEVDRSAPAGLVLRRAGTFYLCALGFLAAILLIGFTLAAPLFMVFYLRRFSHAGWTATLALTGALTGLVLGLFDALLHVAWPDHLLGHLLDRWSA